MATICKKAADAVHYNIESVSYEEMLSSIDARNADPFNPFGQVIIRLDAVALYPSMEGEETSQICVEIICSSGLRVETIDLEDIGIYFTLTEGEENIPPEIIPQRKYIS